MRVDTVQVADIMETQSESHPEKSSAWLEFIEPDQAMVVRRFEGINS